MKFVNEMRKMRLFTMLSTGVCLMLPAWSVQASDAEIFSAMDAQIATMWQQRDDMRESLEKAGLLAYDHEADLHHHHLHDHHNEHGVGGDDVIDDIDVLASSDVLVDKINELSKTYPEEHSDKSASVDDELMALTEVLSDNKAIIKSEPEQRATGHLLGIRPVVNARVTSKYGYRRIFGRSQFHKGIDLAAKYGSPIYATGAGRVTYAGWMRGYGRFVEIDHENGYKTRYAHNARLRVKVGNYVAQNQHIADLGCSGRCTGPHLHYEVKKHGKHVNPDIFLAMAPRR